MLRCRDYAGFVHRTARRSKASTRRSLRLKIPTPGAAAAWPHSRRSMAVPGRPSEATYSPAACSARRWRWRDACTNPPWRGRVYRCTVRDGRRGRERCSMASIRREVVDSAVYALLRVGPPSTSTAPASTWPEHSPPRRGQVPARGRGRATCNGSTRERFRIRRDYRYLGVSTWPSGASFAYAFDGERAAAEAELSRLQAREIEVEAEGAILDLSAETLAYLARLRDTVAACIDLCGGVEQPGFALMSMFSSFTSRGRPRRRRRGHGST